MKFKLKEYNQKKFPQVMRNVGEAKLSLNPPKNNFTISAAASELMNLKHGDKVTIAQDEEHPEDWYIYKDHSDCGMKVGAHKKGQKAVRFRNAALMVELIKLWDLDDQYSWGIKITGSATIVNGLKLFPLITTSAKKMHKLKKQ